MSGTAAAIVVHGGAGSIPPEERPAHEAGLAQAAGAGWEILRGGGSALDAVAAAVRVLEDDPAFNAGRGSVLRLDGTVELDASIMEGTGRRAGAVACVHGVRHPVHLARRVMERTPHVLIVGPGAEAFAGEEGIATEPPAFFEVERERARLWRLLREGRTGDGARHAPGDTVGAVARDRRGGTAAATSTGGAPGARPGRVGDSPIPGAGTLADDRRGAVSCTGQGEAILRAGLATDVLRRVGEGRPASEAAASAVAWLHAETGGRCGLICLDAHGRTGAAYDTAWMGSLARTDG